jgi:NAD+ synthase
MLNYTLAQINPTVGALHSNVEKVLDVWEKAEGDLVIFPELVVTGYPPEDLVLKPDFIAQVETRVHDMVEQSKGFAAGALISCPWRIDDALYNAALLIDKGELIAVQAKHHLPNESVFDEKRIFQNGPLPAAIEFRGHKIGVLICEDMWAADVASHLKTQGAEIFITLNASPYTVQKSQQRIVHAHARCVENDLPLIYVNQVGGQDELVFDGASFVMNAQGEIIQQLTSFEENVRTFSLKDASVPLKPLDIKAQMYGALVLGVRDYINKNNFPGILLGLSGGIDSALAAIIAVDAIGAGKVHCVMMPSRYTSQDSLDDAAQLAENLGCTYETKSIDAPMAAFEGLIEGLNGTAHENMQSRSRALILMALSNANGKMVLSTGNKSEMAVGYATLYGDMCGGYNALKDVYKTQVYALSTWRNEQEHVMPERIITKAPTAELKDNQTDQDSLPPYDVLDDILECMIEREMSIEDTVKRGHDAATVKRVWKMLDMAEYKRKQAPPGVVITTKAFGRDRRYPITNHFLRSITED